MGLARTVVSCDLVTDLIQDLLEYGAQTNLVICGTRSEFLVQLSAAIQLQKSDPYSAPRQDLLTKSIGLLANSSKIQLTFCPSLESLRAYLAALPVPKKASPTPEEGGGLVPLLTIVDAVAMHGTTMEFAAQGLSRTFAAAVEAGTRAGMDLALCECANVVNPSSTEWGEVLWDTEVPLLNGSLRIRSEEGNWGGRGVSIREIVERWFVFDQDKAH